MLLDKKPYTFDRVVRIGLSVAILLGLIWLLGRISDVLIPFAVALLLAYLINPLVVKIQKKVHNRVHAVFLSLFIVVFILVLLGAIIFPMVFKEVKDMGGILSEVVNNSDLAERASKHLPEDIWLEIKKYASDEKVQNFFKADNIYKILKEILGKVLPGVWGVISGTTSFIMGIIGLSVIGLYLVFLLLDYQKIRKEWKSLIPPAYREPLLNIVGDFNIGMNRYFRGQAMVAAIVGVLFAFGFYLIGMPMGIILGLLIGLLNMVPYLQIIGFIPSVIFASLHALETGSSIWVMLALTVLVFIIVQTIQELILVPKIMGKVTGLSPAMILLSLSIWGKLLGIFGLLIALPVTCLLLAYYKRFILLSSSYDDKKQ